MQTQAWLQDKHANRQKQRRYKTQARTELQKEGMREEVIKALNIINICI